MADMEPQGTQVAAEAAGADGPQMANARWLFWASCVSLIATAMAFAIRADIQNDLMAQFKLNDTQMGWVVGAWALGFSGSILFGGPLCDLLGMGRIMMLAFIGHAAGCVLTIIAPGFGLLFAGTLIVGIGNGLVEAAINPLVATMFPNDKTTKLNLLHAWFPGGIVIGGVICYLISLATADLPPLYIGSHRIAIWQIKQAVLLLPVVIYGVMLTGQKLPVTERVAAGVSTGDMFREAARPLYILILVAMVCTASTELVTNQWVPGILARSMEGFAAASILVLVWINLIMCVGRFFAGPLARAISPTGIILSGALVSAVGILLLSMAQSTVGAFGAAFVFAVGVCFFWPTMLGITSERFPKGGALLLAMTGSLGSLSVFIVNPIFGGRVDRVVEETGSPQGALPMLIILPVIAFVIFLGIFLMDKAKGGYKAEAIAGEGDDAPPATEPE